tara:strand:+ start:5160 stop:6188 length:1029 start_codon:yes stop_codon:yes gene_type:complete
VKKIILLLLFVPLFSIGQDAIISDGPYIFIEKNKLIKKSIINSEVIFSDLDKSSYDTLYLPEKSTYNNVKKIIALSDIHGQYDLTIELLKNNKVIDKELNWNFGKGHLVIAGDIFDRGDKVNEVLWLVYKLEIQAKSDGGRVHFVLGNHEFMVLQKDLRYIHKKYIESSKLIGLEYDQLYSDKTILGRWLRSKPSIIKINNNVFTHGGVSEEFLINRGVDFEKINLMMRYYIDTPLEQMNSSIYDLYNGEKSLIWYRDYFKEYGEDLTDADISKILKMLNTKHIVVGHCSYDQVVQLYNNKIFGVDSSIKNGKYGEVLLIKKRKFFRGTLKGELIEFKKKSN